MDSKHALKWKMDENRVEMGWNETHTEGQASMNENLVKTRSEKLPVQSWGRLRANQIHAKWLNTSVLVTTYKIVQMDFITNP